MLWEWDFTNWARLAGQQATRALPVSPASSHPELYHVTVFDVGSGRSSALASFPDSAIPAAVIHLLKQGLATKPRSALNSKHSLSLPPESWDSRPLPPMPALEYSLRLGHENRSDVERPLLMAVPHPSKLGRPFPLFRSPLYQGYLSGSVLRV